ncbi:hypothetical protein K458DRAFT_486862 [Lentithecium fluviatile CBS 122367]|uniref:DUF6594 domain-containing protein n=1 Tax=Lentithecium fluviatile CBS 122367 TaxID=1168545 RepID=A0A6G1J4T4_9PLEO|nr:hypothetical protein K458DRAFT_486862 [Lentithecium fluviatile CBS 122367]
MAQASLWKPRGYLKLASVMGRSNDVAIFRRFNELNMLNLLSMQAELAKLREEFWVQCQADDVAGPPYEKFSQNYQALRDASSTSTEKQQEILTKIGTRMKEYNELLLQVSQLSRANKPLKEDLSFLRDWLRDSKGGADFLARNQNDESFLYEKDTQHDLITMSQYYRRSPEQDPFARLLRKRAIYLYHMCIGQHRKNKYRIADEESQTVAYDESMVERGANLIATVLSSVLPLVAIVILNQSQDTQKRIYIAVGITAAFALILALSTNARRVEIFAATATFAAVEVVFIGSVVQQNPSN